MNARSTLGDLAAAAFVFGPAGLWTSGTLGFEGTAVFYLAIIAAFSYTGLAETIKRN